MVFLKISQKFTGIHLCQGLFFNKVEASLLTEPLRTTASVVFKQILFTQAI